MGFRITRPLFLMKRSSMVFSQRDLMRQKCDRTRREGVTMYSKEAIEQNDRTLGLIATWFWRVCIVGFLIVIMGSISFWSYSLAGFIRMPAFLFFLWHLVLSLYITLAIKLI